MSSSIRLARCGGWAVGAEVIAGARDGRDHAVVGRDQVAAGRVVGARHLLGGNHAVPLVLAGPPRYWQPAVDGGPARDLRPDEVADVTAGVGGDQVVIDHAPVAYGPEQGVDRVGPQHRQQAVQRPVELEELDRLERQGAAAGRVAGDDRAVDGLGDVDAGRLRASDLDVLGCRSRPLPVALIPVAGRVGLVELLDVQVVNVGERVRHAPGDVPVVPEVGERRHARGP